MNIKERNSIIASRFGCSIDDIALVRRGLATTGRTVYKSIQSEISRVDALFSVAKDLAVNPLGQDWPVGCRDRVEIDAHAGRVAVLDS